MSGIEITFSSQSAGWAVSSGTVRILLVSLVRPVVPLGEHRFVSSEFDLQLSASEVVNEALVRSRAISMLRLLGLF